MRAACSLVCCCVASSDWLIDSTLSFTSPTESRTKPLLAHPEPVRPITHSTASDLTVVPMVLLFECVAGPPASVECVLLDHVPATRAYEQSWLTCAEH